MKSEEDLKQGAEAVEAAMRYFDGAEEKDPEQGSRQARDVINNILADLDRKWRIPPATFVRQLAKEMVGEMADSPKLLSGLAKQLAAEMLLAELRGHGIRLTVRDGRLHAGPARAVTEDLKQRIMALRETLVQILSDAA